MGCKIQSHSKTNIFLIMSNEFKFKVYEDSKADCLKVYKSSDTILIEITDSLEINLIGEYMSEDNGTSISKGLSEAVKKAQKVRTIIHVFFIIENNEPIIGLPIAPIPIGYKPSLFNTILQFIICKSCKRYLWFKLLEKTTLHHFILGVLCLFSFVSSYKGEASNFKAEANAAAQEYIRETKYKFLALISWYALYASIAYFVFKHFTSN